MGELPPDPQSHCFSIFHSVVFLLLCLLQRCTLIAKEVAYFHTIEADVKTFSSERGHVLKITTL